MGAKMRRAVVIAAGVLLVAAACASGDGARTVMPTPAAEPSLEPSPPASATLTPATPTVKAEPTIGGADALQPLGYPLDPDSLTDRVQGAVGARVVAPREGATVRQTSERLQVSDDAERANEDGWGCRVHVEYEGQPAVDWYVQPGQPVIATMDGHATLFVNTVANAFDYYRVAREPYLGNPDRSRAPLSPFPGPGGGMGLYVSVSNDDFRIDLGHLALEATIGHVPRDAFTAPFSPVFDYRSAFAVPRAVSSGDIVAEWDVRRGDTVGYTGDSGYSEAPHLHYAITRRADARRLCATEEAGFADGGWLTRPAP